jgi:hypothetical protein
MAIIMRKAPAISLPEGGCPKSMDEREKAVTISIEETMLAVEAWIVRRL